MIPPGRRRSVSAPQELGRLRDVHEDPAPDDSIEVLHEVEVPHVTLDELDVSPTRGTDAMARESRMAPFPSTPTT